MDYYVDINGQTKGPFTIHQLRSMWSAGDVTGQTLYCQEGMTEWIPLGYIQDELEPRPASRTPPSSMRASTPPPERKTSGVGRVLGVGCLGIICFFILVAIIGAISGGGGGGGSDSNFDAYYTATASFVPAHLKAPSTAKFADYRECSVSVDGDVYTVSGWVDAQNSFGAMIRQRFICKLRLEQSRGKWVHIDTTIF